MIGFFDLGKGQGNLTINLDDCNMNDCRWMHQSKIVLWNLNPRIFSYNDLLISCYNFNLKFLIAFNLVNLASNCMNCQIELGLLKFDN